MVAQVLLCWPRHPPRVSISPAVPGVREGGGLGSFVLSLSFSVFSLVQAHGGLRWDLNLHTEASFRTGRSPPFCLPVSSVSLKTWCLEQFQVPGKTERRHGDFPRGLPLQFPSSPTSSTVSTSPADASSSPGTHSRHGFCPGGGGGACSMGVDGCAVVRTSTPTSGRVDALPWACRAPRLHVPPCPQPLETARLSAASVHFPFQNVTELASHPMWPSQLAFVTKSTRQGHPRFPCPESSRLLSAG